MTENAVQNLIDALQTGTILFLALCVWITRRPRGGPDHLTIFLPIRPDEPEPTGTPDDQDIPR